MPTGLLRKHCASLTHSDGGWLLTYPIVSYCEYGERVPERIDIALPIVAENYAGAYKLAKLILPGLLTIHGLEVFLHYTLKPNALRPTDHITSYKPARV